MAEQGGANPRDERARARGAEVPNLVQPGPIPVVPAQVPAPIPVIPVIPVVQAVPAVPAVQIPAALPRRVRPETQRALVARLAVENAALAADAALARRQLNVFQGQQQQP